VLAPAAAPPLPAAARGNTGGWYPCHAPHPAQPTANLAQKKSQSALTGSCGDAFGLAVVVTGVLATTGMREALAGSITVAGTVTTLGALRAQHTSGFHKPGLRDRHFELDQTAEADLRKMDMCSRVR